LYLAARLERQTSMIARLSPFDPAFFASFAISASLRLWF
jgi:hypothetical protein